MLWMTSYSQIVDFLPAGSRLMVSVKPPDDLDPELKSLLFEDLEEFPYKKGVYAAPIYLEQTLKIRFFISGQWNIKRELEKCQCTTNIVRGKCLDSVNGAYQAISEVVEPHRSSRGGKVYTNVFFESNNGSWTQLEVRSEELFEPYKADYNEKVSVYKERTSTYIKPHPTTERFFQVLLEKKEKIIETLYSEKQSQSAQIQQLDELFKQSKLAVYQEKLKEFEQRLEQNYPETSGDDPWQLWIYKNNWLFATQYTEPLPKERVGFHNIPDFIFPTLDGFIDVLEIKKPTFEVLVEDASHHGSYKWSKETNEAIGQAVNYLYEIELHQLEIVKRIEEKQCVRLSAVKPRAIILIGESAKWVRQKHEALRKLNHALHCVEVITYTDLLQRGKRLLSIYDAG